LVDLYRTLVSLAMGDAGAALIQKDVDGMDLSGVFDDTTVMIRNYSFSQYSRCPGELLIDCTVDGLYCG
jgi:hypothetical protein